MAVASTRTISIRYTGDLTSSADVAAAPNSNAPGDMDVFSLAAGFNLITLPTGGTAPRGATIIPPAGNAQTITLKGVTGDTGIVLSTTDPTSIAFSAATPATFGLTAGGIIDGLRIIWT